MWQAFSPPTTVELTELVTRLWRGDDDALNRLQLLGAEAAPAVPALGDAVRQGGKRLRLDALSVLEGIGHEALPAIAALREAMRAADPDISVAAANTLGAVGPGAVPGLTEDLAHADWRVRYAACLALGAIGAPASEAVPDLVRCVEDPREDVRSRAVWALGEIGDHAALEPLTKLFGHAEGSMALRITETFARLGSQQRSVGEVLRDRLSISDEDLTLSAARALLELRFHEEAAVWALITLLDHRDHDVRLEAILILADAESKAAPAIPALLAARADDNEEIRSFATVAISKIRPEYLR